MRNLTCCIALLLTATSTLQAQQTCPVTLSAFAEASIQALEDRYCDQAQQGYLHENLPTSDPVQIEKDTILMLLTFALVQVEWDTSRGHQICGVIVDRFTDDVMWVDLNSNYVNNSPIDHAEARAVRNYIQAVNDAGTSDSYWELLDGTTIYSSLEPCQMCAGTINMARVDRVVFGMEDDGFGDALDYLHAFPYHANFEFHSTTRTAQALIAEVLMNPTTSVTTVIRNSQYAFEYAVEDLEAFVVTYPQNQQALDNALATLQAHQDGPPPVADGTFGTPLQAERSGAAADEINVTWDAASCSAADYNLIYGDLAGVGGFGVDGSACGMGTGGTYTWTGVPAGHLWFLVLAIDDQGFEGSWGYGANGLERNSTNDSGQCGVVGRDNSSTCP